jgi:hypothetical protein
MQIEESQPSTILPGKDVKESISIDNIEKQIQSLIAEKNFKLLDTYKRYSATSSIALYRDILKNLEDFYKNLTFENDNQKLILSKIFDTLKSQFSIIETLQIENNKEDILILLFVTTFLHLKKLLS